MATEVPVSDVQAVARALGTLAQVSVSGVAAARYKLLGVAAGADGVALIAVDDQPGRPYRLHSILPDDARVMALGRDTAVLRLRDGQVLSLRVAPVLDGAPSSPSAPASAALAAASLEVSQTQEQPTAADSTGEAAMAIKPAALSGVRVRKSEGEQVLERLN